MLTALASLRTARAGLSEAQHALFPEATIGGDASHRHADGGSSDSFSASADMKWSWNLAGADLSNETARRYEALASEISVADARRSSRPRRLRRTSTCVRRGSPAIAEDTVRNYEESAEIAGWRAGAGLSSASEAEDAPFAGRLRPSRDSSAEGDRSHLSKRTGPPDDDSRRQARSGHGFRTSGADSPDRLDSRRDADEAS